MSDKIDFFCSVCRPEIDSEDEIRSIDITIRDESQLSPAMPVKQDGNEVTAASWEKTNFMSISL